jgi:predicted transcriptional regulator
MTDMKKVGGRPRKYAGKRPTWTIRLEEKYGEQIKALAEKTGRSISEVCERQIVDSFRMEIIIDLLEARGRELEASRDSLMLRVEEMASALAKHRLSSERSVFGRPVKNAKRRRGHARGSI